jgi:hypothetical protein
MAGLLAGCLFLGGALALRGSARSSDPDLRHRIPLGDTLPWLVLRTAEDSAVNLHDRLHGRPAIIYIANQAECTSCSNLPLEFAIIRKEWPGIQPLLIATGASAAEFDPYLRQLRMQSDALIDEHSSLLKKLDIESEPVSVLVDSTGRILILDLRAGLKIQVDDCWCAMSADAR